MTIVHNKRASSTPAFALIAEGWNELVQAGLTPEGVGCCPVKADDEVLFAVRDDEIVGVVCFAAEPSCSYLQVILGYVEPLTQCGQ